MTNFIKEWAGTVALIAIVLTWAIPSPSEFGASGTRFPNGLSTTSTSPAAGEIRTTDLVVGDTASITGTTTAASTTVKSFMQGGNVFATTSQGATTYTAADIEVASLIRHTASAALTATLPASSTFSSAFIPTPGDRKDICLYAITTLITLADGTGTEINTASSTKNVNAAGLGCMTFIRDSDTDIEVLLTTGS